MSPQQAAANSGWTAADYARRVIGKGWASSSGGIRSAVADGASDLRAGGAADVDNAPRTAALDADVTRARRSADAQAHIAPARRAASSASRSAGVNVGTASTTRSAS